jgi:hypothetical protein
MPYVTQETRTRLDAGGEPETPGEVNYVLTRIVTSYVARKGLSYATINDLLGALTGAREEFYRRVAAPYEDDAIARNGDVY